MIWPCGMASSFKAMRGQHLPGLIKEQDQQSVLLRMPKQSPSLLAL